MNRTAIHLDFCHWQVEGNTPAQHTIKEQIEVCAVFLDIIHKQIETLLAIVLRCKSYILIVALVTLEHTETDIEIFGFWILFLNFLSCSTNTLLCYFWYVSISIFISIAIFSNLFIKLD